MTEHQRLTVLHIGVGLIGVGSALLAPAIAPTDGLASKMAGGLALLAGLGVCCWAIIAARNDRPVTKAVADLYLANVIVIVATLTVWATHGLSDDPGALAIIGHGVIAAIGLYVAVIMLRVRGIYMRSHTNRTGDGR